MASISSLGIGSGVLTSDLVEQLVFLRAIPQAVERAQGLLVHLVQRPGDIVDAVEHVVNLLLLGQQVIQLCLQVRAVGG